MATLGFHASHEQIAPAQLLRDVQLADAAGFTAAMCSDHFTPWSHAQGHSGFAWSWLGAALATTNLTFGTVTAPGQRYHPAVIAQAAATLASMFPDRFWLAQGSGEFLNESITGDPWPPKEDRQLRLEECVDAIRALLAGDEVNHRGKVQIRGARLWDLPSPAPPLMAPAISPETAARSAGWADGIITVNQPHERLRQLLGAYRDNGGRGPALLQVHLSWAATEAEAMELAMDQWRDNVFQPPIPADLPTIEHFEAVGRATTPELVRQAVLVSSDTSEHAQWLHEFAELGFDFLYLHHVGQEQSAFIDAFADSVLPLFPGDPPAMPR